MQLPLVTPAKNRCIAAVDAVSFQRLLKCGFQMQRDDDYLRTLLLEIEAHHWWAHPNNLAFGDTEEDTKRYYHILLLVDAGLMAPIGDDGSMVRITNAGYDFIAMLREDATWQKVKKAGGHLGGASVQMLYRIAESFARQKLAEMGLPLG